MTMITTNPATGDILKQYEEMTDSQVSGIIESTHQAFLKWQNTQFSERSEKMRQAAELLRIKKDEYALLMAKEMGKPVVAGRKEIEKCAWLCEHYAEHAEGYLKPREIATEMKKSYVTYRPMGIVFAIMPWNFPFWQVFRFACPTLMAGNGGLLKHAEISTGTGLAIESFFKMVGFPENLFRTLVISNNAAEKVIENPRVTAVTLTGSERAGRAVGAEAGKHLKRVVLELGGSDPYLILEDADLEQTAEAIVVSRLNNSGQVCIAAKRVIAVKAVREKLENLVIERLNRFVIGDPMDETVNFGPMARKDIRDEVAKQVEQSIAQGAVLKVGGKIPDQPGFYYPPTVLSNVKKGMTAFEEEIFGPVVTFIEVENEAEGIALANDTRFGLGAAVFTQDLARGEDIAVHKIHAGSCFVNAYVASDPRLPFGGIKASGYGRELSEEGIREFMNVKTICVK